jgi:sugar/nucleoside kinase (ribokinase family)
MTIDGSVTIVNHRGVADKLERNDIDKDIIESSHILYIVAEMFFSNDSRDAVECAVDIALYSNRKIALAMNNLYFDRNQNFLSKADFIFGNMNEFKYNFQNRDISSLREENLIYIITDGGNGAYIAGKGHNIHVPVIEKLPNKQVSAPSYVGAGDQFAAGFLFGYARGLPLDQCGRLGAETALAVLHASGARPHGDWTELAAKYRSS